MIPTDLLTYQEAEQRYHCDKKTIRNAILAGLVESYKPGKIVLIDLKSADNWFMSTKQQPKLSAGRPRKGDKRR